MASQGGIDTAVVDRAGSAEEEIRSEVHRVCGTCCGTGYFIPSITYGVPGFIHEGGDESLNEKYSAFMFNKQAFSRFDNEQLQDFGSILSGIIGESCQVKSQGGN